MSNVPLAILAWLITTVALAYFTDLPNWVIYASGFLAFVLVAFA
jgi:Mg2+/Co2+ transporter CorB